LTLSDGTTTTNALAGPGFGNMTEATMSVRPGEIIAMLLNSDADTMGGTAHTFYGFAQANEAINGTPVGHLWNYGFNTWGFEDTFGGGDRDYNDVVVQLDFTSMAGHQLLK
jgi:hypothetical protein